MLALSPSSPERRERARAFRSSLYELRESARALAERITVRTCGVWCAYGGRGVAGQGVIDFVLGQLRPGAPERAKTVGTHACGSVWECPVCHARIVSTRAQEVTEFARTARERGMTLRMLTFTIRHGWTDALKANRELVTKAFRATTTSRGVRALREAEGWHFVRAMEVTHGPNGWHPHLHVLLAVERTPDAASDERRRAAFESAWLAAVANIGEAWNVPLAGIAVVQNPVDVENADYLQKLGLEIADDTSKEARQEGHRKPFRILAQAREGCVASARLWRVYARGMVGARCLDWGHGVRVAFGLKREVTNEDLAHERADAPTDRTVLSIDAATFRRAIASRSGLHARVLDAIEKYSVGEALAEIYDAHGGGERGDSVVAAVIESHRWITRRRQAQYEEDSERLYVPRQRRLSLVKPRKSSAWAMSRTRILRVGDAAHWAPWGLDAWRFAAARKRMLSGLNYRG